MTPFGIEFRQNNLRYVIALIGIILDRPQHYLMEDKMTSLKSLNFTALPKTETDPKLERRTRTITRLEEQKLLLSNPSYVRKVRSFATVEGVRKSVESDQRVSPWWRKNVDGSYLFAIRSGSKAIEFEKGKAAIAIPSLDKLPAVIDTLIAATRSGELDTQLAQASRTPPTRRKAS